jgi:hypothetical protein
MKFGELKSKIETCLTESYKNKNLKRDLFVFEELVLKNKNISQVFFLYDELSSNKGLSESVANEFINESITAYENLVNKITPNQIKELKAWVGHIKCENTYKNIDDLFSSNVLTLENKIKSKKTILESLKNKPQEHKEVIEVPLNSMVNVANKTVEKYISSLSESEQKELKTILSTPKESLIENYGKIKDEVVNKLNTQKEGSDSETQETINKVLNKVQTESFNELNYYKLKQLNEVL